MEQKRNEASSDNGVKCIQLSLYIKNYSNVYKGMSTLSVTV